MYTKLLKLTVQFLILICAQTAYAADASGEYPLDGKGIICSCNDTLLADKGAEFCLWKFGFLIRNEKASHYKLSMEKDFINFGVIERVDYMSDSKNIYLDVLKDGSFYYTLNRETLTLSYGAFQGYVCKSTQNPRQFLLNMLKEKSILEKYFLDKRKSNKI